MAVSGISHLTFIVRDLERTATLMRDVFDAREVYDSGAHQFSLSREKFFLIGGVWIAIMEGEPLSERTYNHVAFQIEEAEFDLYVDRVRAAGVDMREPRPRVEGEGRSVYFHDFDNHLFELHTGTLEQRLVRYAEAAVPESPMGNP